MQAVVGILHHGRGSQTRTVPRPRAVSLRRTLRVRAACCRSSSSLSAARLRIAHLCVCVCGCVWSWCNERACRNHLRSSSSLRSSALRARSSAFRCARSLPIHADEEKEEINASDGDATPTQTPDTKSQTNSQTLTVSWGKPATGEPPVRETDGSAICHSGDNMPMAALQEACRRRRPSRNPSIGASP